MGVLGIWEVGEGGGSPIPKSKCKNIGKIPVRGHFVSGHKLSRDNMSLVGDDEVDNGFEILYCKYHYQAGPSCCLQDKCVSKSYWSRYLKDNPHSLFYGSLNCS